MLTYRLRLLAELRVPHQREPHRSTLKMTRTSLKVAGLHDLGIPETPRALEKA